MGEKPYIMTLLPLCFLPYGKRNYLTYFFFLSYEPEMGKLHP